MRWMTRVIPLGAVFALQPSCGGSTSSSDGGGGSGGAAGAGGSTAGSAGGGAGGSTAGSGAGGSSGSTGGASGVGGSAGSDTACTVTSDCVLMSESCCGQCGAVTRDDHVVLNREAATKHTATRCSQGQGCPECYMPQDPALIATCRAGQCVLVDLLEEEITTCQTDDDCVLRTHDCCECGGDHSEGGLVAVRRDGIGGLIELVCDPPQACDDCLPPGPTGVKADCETGRCEVVWTGG